LIYNKPTPRVLKTFLLFCGVIGALFAVECISFFLTMADDTHLERADVIIVFGESESRVNAGYALATQGLTNALIVSHATKDRCNVYTKKYHLPSDIQQIIEAKARTTFENALYTSKLIKNNTFTSAILVTSFHHMPRSNVLLRLLLVGTPITIQTHGIPVGILNSATWVRSTVGMKLMYNEMIEFWGSIGEFVYYKITGHVPARPLSKNPVVHWLRSVLLFNVYV